MGQKVAGRFTITISGILLESMPGATCVLGGLNKTPVNTDQQRTHRSEEYVNSLTTGTIPVLTKDSIEDIRNVEDAELTFTADNGVEYTVTGATANEAGGWTFGKDGVEASFFGEEAKAS